MKEYVVEITEVLQHQETDKHHQNRPPPGLCNGNPHGQLRPYRFRQINKCAEFCNT